MSVARRVSTAACFVLPALLLALSADAVRGQSAAPGQYSEPAAGAQTSSYAPALKRLQQRLLLQGARARMARAKALTHLLRKHPEQVRPGAGVRWWGDWNEAGGPQGTGTRAPGERAASSARATAALVPDVLVNDRTRDNAYSVVGQADPSNSTIFMKQKRS